MFSHGRSIGFLPPSGKLYPTDLMMGCAFSFRKEVFVNNTFSNYFEGYGLYEDAEFCIRVAKTGPLFINTAATLGHFHDSSGRPNQLKYGKMVVRNGYVIWKSKNPDPNFEEKIKWHAITLLLIAIRASNAICSKDKLKAFSETRGRLIGWFSLMFNKPIL